MNTVDTYTDLAAGLHAAQPKFKAVIENLVRWSVDAQSQLSTMPAKRDIDLATGVHLDALGVWIGFARTLFVPTLGTVSLSDADYRILLRARIAIDYWDGTYDSLQKILGSLFPGTGTIVYALDNQNMSINIVSLGTALTATRLALLTQGFLSPKPAGVRIAGISAITGPLFGLDTQDDSIAGPDTGAFL